MYEGALDTWMSALWIMLYQKYPRLLPNGPHFVNQDAGLIDQPRVRIIFHDAEEGVPPLSTTTGCYILNNGKDRLKTFDEKSDEGIFVGYSSVSKAYRVYNKRRMTTEESVHTVFDEPQHIPTGIEDLTLDIQNISLSEPASQNQHIVELEVNPAAVRTEVVEADDVQAEAEITAPQETVRDPELEPDRRWLRDHPQELIIGDLDTGVSTRRRIQNAQGTALCTHNEETESSQFHVWKSKAELRRLAMCTLAVFLAQSEPLSTKAALEDSH
ncbi:hypothetical protein OROGR_019522 [Orobanche gracilis]